MPGVVGKRSSRSAAAVSSARCGAQTQQPEFGGGLECPVWWDEAVSEAPGPSGGLAPLRAEVEAVLRELPDEVILWANAGNAGDALIRVATAQALQRSGVRVLPPDTEVRGRTVLVIGGGNLVPLYAEANDAIAGFAAAGAERIVVLPHTIRGNPSALGLLRPHDLVMCRDAPSHATVVAPGTAAEVALAHDMAFHLDVTKILGDAALARLAEPAMAARVPAGLRDPAAQDVVVLTRTDAERGPVSPPGNLDPSRAFAFGGGATASLISTWSLLTFVSRCPAIVTDRLHVAIAAALLGVPCTVLPNSYDKNLSVYEHSLRHFPTVRFDATAADAADGS